MKQALTHQEMTLNHHRLHIVTAGDEHIQSIVFLHGWPEDWSAWEQVMHLASKTYHVVAFDLPGVGKSHGPIQGGTKAALSELIHEAIGRLELKDYVIVGHDIGAMVAYRYVKQFPSELRAAVLMDSVIPGIDPWTKILANPYIWHFAFHNTMLPEAIVSGHARVYFDYFFDTLTKNHSAITNKARTHYTAAYRTADALQAGFDWYRGLTEDAKENKADVSKVDVPTLYVRGEFEGGDIDEYAMGFRQAGFASIKTAYIPGSSHFTPEENPNAVWSEISQFLSS